MGGGGGGEKEMVFNVNNHDKNNNVHESDKNMYMHI